MNEKFLSELSARLAALAADNPAKDFEKNVRALLSSAFSRLDLVSREEYEVQTQVLARAREKLAALEARVAELEAKRGATKAWAWSCRSASSSAVRAPRPASGAARSRGRPSAIPARFASTWSPFRARACASATKARAPS